MLVYANDDHLSFQEMVNFWIQEVNKYKEEDCEIMILSNKSDMPIDAVS